MWGGHWGHVYRRSHLVCAAPRAVKDAVLGDAGRPDREHHLADDLREVVEHRQEGVVRRRLTRPTCASIAAPVSPGRQPPHPRALMASGYASRLRVRTSFRADLNEVKFTVHSVTVAKSHWTRTWG